MAASVPILTFHALEDDPSVISFSPRRFREAVARLYDGGYRTLRLAEAVDFLRQGRSFPPRRFLITFDDGYRTVYEQAFPTLQRYRLAATVFLTVGEARLRPPSGRLPSLGGRRMLAWSEIREMHGWGVDFGAHTLTHRDLSRLPRDRLAAEVCDSKAVIEDALGAPVTCFAYPYGVSDRWSRATVREHFSCACSARLGLVTARSDPYALERLDAYYIRTGRLLGMMSTRVFPWYVRLRAVPRRLRRAVLPGSRSRPGHCAPA